MGERERARSGLVSAVAERKNESEMDVVAKNAVRVYTCV